MGEREEKMRAASMAGMSGPMGPDLSEARRWRPHVLQVEALDGGFIVMIPSADYGPDHRKIVPNADALVSVVQCWAHEASNGR